MDQPVHGEDERGDWRSIAKIWPAGRINDAWLKKKVIDFLSTLLVRHNESVGKRLIGGLNVNLYQSSALSQQNVVERHQFEFSTFNGLPLKRPPTPKPFFIYLFSLDASASPYFLSALIHQRCVRRFRELVQFVAENDRDLNSQTDLRQDIFQSDKVLSSHGGGKNNFMRNDCMGIMRSLLGWNTVQGAMSSDRSVEQYSNYNSKWRQGN